MGEYQYGVMMNLLKFKYMKGGRKEEREKNKERSGLYNGRRKEKRR
jgi:hypothetical protein